MKEPGLDKKHQERNILHGKLMIELIKSFHECDMTYLGIAAKAYGCVLETPITFSEIITRLEVKGLLSAGKYATLKKILGMAELIELRDVVEECEKKMNEVIVCSTNTESHERRGGKRRLLEGDSSSEDRDKSRFIQMNIKIPLKKDGDEVDVNLDSPVQQTVAKILLALQPLKETVVEVKYGSLFLKLNVFTLLEFLRLLRWCLDGTLAQKMKPVCLDLVDKKYRDDLCVRVELQTSTREQVEGLHLLGGIQEEKFHGLVSESLFEETEQCITELGRLQKLLAVENRDDIRLDDLQYVEGYLRVLYDEFKVDFEDSSLSDAPFSSINEGLPIRESRVRIFKAKRTERDPKLQYIRDRASAMLKDWKERTNGLVLTKAVLKARNLLKKDGCLQIIGEPGQGKTTVGMCLLQESEREGYEPIAPSCYADIELCQTFERMYAFFINDAEIWNHSSMIGAVVAGNNRYILIAKQRLCNWTTLDLDSNENLINDTEKVEMIQIHMATRNIETINIGLYQQGFPSISRNVSSMADFQDEAAKILSRPARDLVHYIDKLAKSCPMKYACLVLVMTCQGSISSEDFNQMDSNSGLKEKLGDISKACNLGTPIPPDAMVAAKESLDNIFLNLRDGFLEFIDHEVEDIVAKSFCLKMPQLTLSTCHFRIIQENVRTDDPSQHVLGQIHIQVDGPSYSTLVQRIIQCIRCGNVRDAVSLKCLKDEGLQQTFVERLRSEEETLRFVTEREKGCWTVTGHGQLRFVDSEKYGSLLYWSVHMGLTKIVEYLLKISPQYLPDKTYEEIFANSHQFVRNSVYYATHSTNNNGESLLHICASKSHWKVFVGLVKRGACVALKDKWGRTPLYYSVTGHDATIANELLVLGSSPNAADMVARTPLFWAVCSGNTELVTLFLQYGANPNVEDRVGRTVLMEASELGFLKLVQSLLQDGANINSRDNEGNTSLHLAASRGHGRVVLRLLQRGADPNGKNNNSETPLHLASENGYGHIVLHLLQKGADVDRANYTGHTPLHVASEHGHVHIITHLLKYGADPSTTNYYETTALHLAAADGQKEIVTHLLENGACSNSKNIAGDTPLHLALEHGHMEIAIQLLRNGADHNSKNNCANTPLHFASMHGNEQMVFILLENGADPNLKNDSGNAPLHLASRRGYEQTVLHLLENGADPNIKNNHGNTPLHLAATFGHEQTVSHLLRNGANPNKKNAFGNAPILLASENGHELSVSCLLRNNADPNSKGGCAFSPLHLASRRGHATIVFDLLQKGAHVNIEDSNGDTPLHLATRYGQENIVSLLLQNGARLNVEDSNGYTPLHLATRYGQKNIVPLLVQNGAHLNVEASNGDTPLHLATRYGQEIIVSLLLGNDADVNSKTSCAETPLHEAAEHGYEQIVLHLLEHDAEPNGKNISGYTPLHLASSCGHVQIVLLLLRHRADCNSKNSYLQTPLHCASEKGHEQATVRLLENGADTNVKDLIGDTPLHLASKHGHVQIVFHLLQHGANPNDKNAHSQTPLNFALELEQEEIVLSLLRIGAHPSNEDSFNEDLLHLASEQGLEKTVLFLLQENADCDCRNTSGDTALHLASRHGHVQIVSHLLENGANIDCKNKDGNTPLHLASRHGSAQLVLLLLQNGADPNCRSNDGNTPFHVASRHGHVQIVLHVLKYGVGLNTHNNDGNTPLHLASRHGHEGVVLNLLQKGADPNRRNISADTPLHLASTNVNVQIVLHLLDKGAEANAQNKHGETPLHLAAGRGDEQMVLCLLRNGADRHRMDKRSRTPYQRAYRQGHGRVESLLSDECSQGDVISMVMTSSEPFLEQPPKTVTTYQEADVERIQETSQQADMTETLSDSPRLSNSSEHIHRSFDLDMEDADNQLRCRRPMKSSEKSKEHHSDIVKEQSQPREEWVRQKKEELLRLLRIHVDNEVKKYQQLFGLILPKEDPIADIEWKQ